jgi:hypothetical protein
VNSAPIFVRTATFGQLTKHISDHAGERDPGINQASITAQWQTPERRPLCPDVCHTNNLFYAFHLENPASVESQARTRASDQQISSQKVALELPKATQRLFAKQAIATNKALAAYIFMVRVLAKCSERSQQVRTTLNKMR